MKFASLHTLVAYLLAGVGFLALSLGDELGLGSRILFGVGWITSLGVSPKWRASSRYQAAWNVVLLAYLAVAVLRLIFLDEGLLALGVELSGALQVIKLFQRRIAKDHQQIQVLAFLHLIAATILSTGLEYALVFFAYVLLVPWMFALTHLRAEIEAHYATDVGGEEGQRAVDKVLASRRIAGWRFLFATASLAVPLFLATAAFFLLFPRVGLGFLSFGDGAGRQMAGFSGEVELGGFGVIRTDPTVVLRVLPDPSERVASNRSFRLRGTSFDRYEDARWSRTPERPRRLTPQLGTFSLQRQSRGREARLQIVLDAIEPPVLFFPIGTVGLELPPRVEGGVDVQRQLVRGRGLDVRYLDGDGLQQRYAAIYEPERPFDAEELTPEERVLYVQLPQETSAEVRALALRIAGGGDDVTRARRVEAWLRDSGELTDSLEQPDTSGRNPLDVFLFEARRGHCEYFSTALAVMLRAVDIPARNVTGFVGGTFNPYGNYYAIRQGDAHSWVEAHVDGRWETFDPTPPARGEMATVDDGFFASIDAIIDALRTSWDDDVVGYDLRQQVEGLRGMFRWFRRLRGSTDEAAPDDSSESAASSTRRLPWASGLVVLGLVVGLALIARAAWRRRRPSAATAHPAAKLYRVLDRRLMKLGRPRPPGRTPREHADLLRAEGYPGAAVVDEVTEAYLASRWGDVPLDAGLRTRIRLLPKPEASPRS